MKDFVLGGMIKNRSIEYPSDNILFLKEDFILF